MQVHFFVPRLSQETEYTYEDGAIYWLCGHEVKRRKVSLANLNRKIDCGEWVVKSIKE
ncbi:hypothetical protein [Thaumasiovibrio subtropicus]|uniref:hypothetical protein n=1 Tax=Thaumasiovibrio subtropicus TaxID=1891207 RepID=UPI00131E1334|nr:hypothetical protein [Thaumasiovibrio subtropicus]